MDWRELAQKLVNLDHAPLGIKVFARVLAERDEAREWARRYKRAYDNAEKVLGDVDAILLDERDRAEEYKHRYESELVMHKATLDLYGETADELDECERKYKQATCEHPNKWETFWPTARPDCGKEY